MGLNFEGMHKLNTDDSSRGNLGPSDFGGVIKDCLGEQKIRQYGSFGYTTLLATELFALYHGLRIDQDKGIRGLICESNSKLSLQLIDQNVTSFHPHASIIKKIQVFKNLRWELHFQHSFREANFCADFLSKMGSYQFDLTLLISYPPLVLPLTMLILQEFCILDSCCQLLFSYFLSFNFILIKKSKIYLKWDKLNLFKK